MTNAAHVIHVVHRYSSHPETKQGYELNGIPGIKYSRVRSLPRYA
jgi:hypothetical protein